jgi:hypothetical protein
MKNLQDTEHSMGPARDQGRKYLLWGCVLLCVSFPVLLVSQGAAVFLGGAALVGFALALFSRWRLTGKPALQLSGWLIGALGAVAAAIGIFVSYRELIQFFTS